MVLQSPIFPVNPRAKTPVAIDAHRLECSHRGNIFIPAYTLSLLNLSILLPTAAIDLKPLSGQACSLL